ncbi:KIAA0825 [Bugula neritina]|uniref:KIAA0825 n=1 Tax=Bugula neritina TaxID=10212 RepID=A0A7J7KAG4_BUGNE|nr:KIAA0825 [Bugula neritina]
MSRIVIPDASLLTPKQNQIEDKIEINTQRIQECLDSIESLLQDLPSAGDTSDLDLEERLRHVSNYHSIEKTACYDLDLEDLQSFLTNISNYITKNPGSEQSILSLLLSLCSHTGLTLPWKVCGQGGQRASVMSLNVVNDEDEQMCDALWEEIRRALEDYVVACLYQLPTADDSLTIRSNRSQYIDKLQLLTSTRQLCQQYRSLRVYCLNQLVNDQLSSEGSSATFPQIVNAFDRISTNVITMIDGDFHLLISGIFKKVSTTFEVISSIYFDKLTDELESVFDDLGNDLFGQLDSKLTSRRQSDIALAGKLKDKISKSARGRDRITSTGTTSIESETSLSSEIAMSIVQLARALNNIDSHVYNLYLMSYTGLRGTSSNSLHSADRIRGVLKSTSVTDISVLSESLTSETSDLPSFLQSGRLHYQLYDKAPQPVVDFVLEMESVFPLAQAEHTLLSVRHTFISAAMSWSKNLLQAFQSVVEERVNITSSNSVILTALSSLALVRNTLYQCDITLQRDNEKQNTFVLAYQACQAVDSLAQQYVALEVELLINLCCTTQTASTGRKIKNSLR